MGFDKENEDNSSLFIQDQFEIGDMLLLSFKAPDNAHQYINNHSQIDSDLAFVGIITETKHNINGIPCYEIYFPSTGTTSHSVILYKGIHVEVLYRLDLESITE